jgi:thioredoxin 1
MRSYYNAPISADDTSFEFEVLAASLPVVAVFCSAQEDSQQQLDAMLKETARDYANVIQVVKLDVADAPQEQARYNVKSLPEFLFFHEGELVARAKGIPSEETLRTWIKYLLRSGSRSKKPHRR